MSNMFIANKTGGTAVLAASVSRFVRRPPQPYERESWFQGTTNTGQTIDIPESQMVLLTSTTIPAAPGWRVLRKRFNTDSNEPHVCEMHVIAWAITAGSVYPITLDGIDIEAVAFSPPNSDRVVCPDDVEDEVSRVQYIALR